MHQCLSIPEVIRHICDEADLKTSLSMALTSRAHLDPALDRIWAHLDSFEPIISCLPSNLWKPKSIPSPNGHGTLNILSLHRAIDLEDIHRYTTFYAPRIRTMAPTPSKRMLAIEAFHGLQLATNAKPGALAPNLRTFEWCSPTTLQGSFGDDFSRQLSAFMSLFIGESVTSITSKTSENVPLHIAAMKSTIQRLPRLRKLDIADLKHEPATDYYLSHVSLDYLEDLTMNSLSPDMVTHLSFLPRLRRLRVSDNRSAEEHDTAWTGVVPNPPRKRNGFPCLEEVEVNSDRPTSLLSILQSLPPANPLRAISCHAKAFCSTQEWQLVLDTVGKFCNAERLTSLNLIDGLGVRMGRLEEPLDVKLCDEVKIPPILYQFKKIRSLDLCFQGGVEVTGDVANKVADAWPRLFGLTLIPTGYRFNRVPSINHKHLVQLLKKLRCLVFLALQFDTTQLTDHEPLPTEESSLKLFLVGASPICSPSRVVTFIKANIPNLEELHTVYKGRGSNPETTMLDKRWDVVQKELRDYYQWT
ncbi:hypothetical protein DFP72DRAFT_902201 [Ephemerocybe angulata]|uniref:F-box domain-containing protein n=1 Tax=Ephemerocybe angulata TaxID=980116 RepID=A0A8H6HV71_9AGAR|nr:hypothetical protein DFP72DRAFT_902201 [Tulosesus angulatus]